MFLPAVILDTISFLVPKFSSHNKQASFQIAKVKDTVYSRK